MKQPIAMRCSKAQFEKIKAKLIKKGLEFNSITDFEEYPYLVNCDGELISNVNLGFAHIIQELNPEIHEEWNEKIFLEACGIETEKTFSITESQIKYLATSGLITTKERLKEMFPEAFESEVKLEVGKWHKWIDGETIVLWFLTKIEGEIIYGYGFLNGNWVDEKVLYSKNHYKEASNELKEATEQEVFEALKNECVKRNIVEGNYVKKLLGINIGSIHDNFKSNQITNEDFIYDFDNNNLFIGNMLVFYNGVWIKPFESITLSEA